MKDFWNKPLVLYSTYVVCIATVVWLYVGLARIACDLQKIGITVF